MARSLLLLSSGASVLVVAFLCQSIFKVEAKEKTAKRMIAGGPSEVKPADAEVQGLVDKVKGDFAASLGQDVGEVTAVSYKTQVVAGTNFFVKVKVGDDFYHLRVFRPLPPNMDQPQFVAFQANKSEQDPIDYFN